jgi:hypothetical protein
MQPNDDSHKPQSSTFALVSDQNQRLTDEQRTRKAWLLSRFRTFAPYSGMIPDYQPQPHDEMCDELESCRPDIGIGTSQKKEVYLAPRFTYKTSLEKAFMAYMILWFMEYGIDISIDYVRAQATLAEDVLFELKMDLETLPTIVELWGDLKGRANIWAQKRINLSGRRDHTVGTSGLDYGSAGKHPDLVLIDDGVNEKNYESVKAKKAMRVKIDSYYAVLPPWGSLIVSGTRFAHNDAYGWILEQNAKDRRIYNELLAEGKTTEAQKHKPQFREYIRRVRDRDGNLFFPAKLTEEFLAQQKRSISAKFYAAWYENDPDVEGMVRFRPEYLKYFVGQLSFVPIPMLTLTRESATGTTYPIDTFPVRVTMTLDPTLTASQTSDRTGITVNATDALGHWWLMYARAHLEVPSRIGDIAVDLLRRYRPSVLRIESANADVDMVARIQRAIMLEDLPTVIASYSVLQDEPGGGSGKPSRRRKNARIEGMEPRFRNGEISWHRGTCNDLYDQYIHWPDVDNDDVFDALAMQYGIAKPCGYKTLDEFEAQDAEREDDEPGWTGTIAQTLYDRWGQPVKITYTAHGDDSEGRPAGRTGLGAQHLRIS